MATSMMTSYGAELFGKFDSLTAVCCLPNNLCLLGSSEQERQAFPHHAVIVYDNVLRLAHLAVTASSAISTLQERSAVGR
jgi:hypothetical protein